MVLQYLVLGSLTVLVWSCQFSFCCCGLMFLESSVLLCLVPMLDIYISSRLGLSVFLLSVDVEGWSRWCLLCGIVYLPHCTLMVYCDGCLSIRSVSMLILVHPVGQSLVMIHCIIRLSLLVSISSGSA